MDIRQNVPLAPMTTFGIGGTARYLAEVRTETEILKALEWARAKGVRTVMLSGGSNVLVPDNGLDVLVVHVGEGKSALIDNDLVADAGCNLLTLIRSSAESGVGGWEKVAGIPGSIGGAVRGNAGAFGTEIKDVAVKVRALNAETVDVREMDNAECDFSYRHSFFKDNPEWIITKVTVSLRPTDTAMSMRLIDETIHERERRHLQNVKAAGSFFMNPVAPPEVVAMFEKEKGVRSREGRVPAGWLIEKAGMKGVKVGGAVASLRHPNYIVNTGGATAQDVDNLAKRIKEQVLKHFGVDLAEEAALLER
ncbi:MAG: UDP-N-acetylmuramate dehydrogenase [Patescibacteria group bacterium]|nr:UDP-N-acetylmuramate dehydrogenase [Patescibacteria group bacterium]